MRLSDQNLQKRTVVAADGLAVGEIAALFLNGETWRVESLQVKLHRDIADRLGAQRSVFRAGMMEVPIRAVQSVGDSVVLSLGVNELRQLLSGDEAGVASSAGEQPTVHH